MSHVFSALCLPGRFYIFKNTAHKAFFFFVLCTKNIQRLASVTLTGLQRDEGRPFVSKEGHVGRGCVYVCGEMVIYQPKY